MDLLGIGQLFNNAYENTGLKQVIEAVEDVIDNEVVDRLQAVGLIPEKEEPKEPVIIADIPKLASNDRGLNIDGYMIFNAVWKEAATLHVETED